MADSRDSPSPPPSSTESSAGSDSSTSSTPPYTPDELAAIFLDFYIFLTTLHYDAAGLKTPLPEGWPGLTPEDCAGFKSDNAIEVLRRLPYFDSSQKAAIHYKSRLIDYTSLGREHFETGDWHEESIEFWSTDGEVDPIHVFFIAWGCESYGRGLLLNVKHGEIIEDMVRADQLDPCDVKSYFDDLREDYRSLKLIPCLGRITIEARDVDERAESDRISEEQVRAQTESWGTDLDVQYIRQLYRQHGWPDAFRKDDAKKAIDALSDSIEEQRGAWEEDFTDW